MTTLSMEAWDAGQTAVRLHSSNMVAREERTLHKASGLSMMDRAMAGATTGGEQYEDAGSFPFSFFGAMTVGRGGDSLSWIGGRDWSLRKKEG